jgi:hypothetical protein
MISVIIKVKGVGCTLSTFELVYLLPVIRYLIWKVNVPLLFILQGSGHMSFLGEALGTSQALGGCLLGAPTVCADLLPRFIGLLCYLPRLLVTTI